MIGLGVIAIPTGLIASALTKISEADKKNKQWTLFIFLPDILN